MTSVIIAGIGYGIAKALAAGGAETIALSRTQADLDRLNAEVLHSHSILTYLTSPKINIIVPANM